MTLKYWFLIIVAIWTLFGTISYLFLGYKRNELNIFKVLIAPFFGLYYGLFAYFIYAKKKESYELFKKYREAEDLHYSMLDDEYESSTSAYDNHSNKRYR